MSLVTNITNAMTRLATESKALRTLINGNAADLSALTTTQKASLVAAVNELQSEINALSGGGDPVTQEDVDTSIAALRTELLGGAGAAFDTFAELKALLDASDTADDAAIATLTTGLGNRVRHDTNAQGLDSTAQANARTNIGAASQAALNQLATDVGDTTTNFVTTFEAGLV